MNNSQIKQIYVITCDHTPMLIYGNNQDLIDNPICRRCGHGIVWNNDKKKWVEINQK